MVAVTGLVGPVTSADGINTAALRQGRTGELLTGDARAIYAEQATRGLMFAGAIPPGTGQAPGTAIGTTACMTLANPSTSTKNLVLVSISVGYISGTLGAGTLMLLAHGPAPIVAPASGTAITPQSLYVGSGIASIANCRFNNTVPATGLALRAICALGAALASTVLGIYSVVDNVAGAVSIAPGAAVSVQGIAAAGTSPLITVAMTWVEELI